MGHDTTNIIRPRLRPSTGAASSKKPSRCASCSREKHPLLGARATAFAKAKRGYWRRDVVCERNHGPVRTLEIFEDDMKTIPRRLIKSIPCTRERFLFRQQERRDRLSRLLRTSAGTKAGTTSNESKSTAVCGLRLSKRQDKGEKNYAFVCCTYVCAGAYKNRDSSLFLTNFQSPLRHHLHALLGYLEGVEVRVSVLLRCHLDALHASRRQDRKARTANSITTCHQYRHPRPRHPRPRPWCPLATQRSRVCPVPCRHRPRPAPTAAHFPKTNDDDDHHHHQNYLRLRQRHQRDILDDQARDAAG